MTREELSVAFSELGFTARIFAAAFNLSHRGVNRWQNGSRPVPPWVDPLIAEMREDPMLAARFRVRGRQ